MSKLHEADDRFVDELERQLGSELRRRQRFGARPPVRRRRVNGRSMLLVALCLVAGVVVARTVDRFEDLRRVKLLVARIETEIELNELRQGVAEAVVAELAARVEAGTVPTEELHSAELQARMLELESQRMELNREESLHAMRAPDDDIAAPLVDGRDYVTERLELELRRREEIRRSIEGKKAAMQARVLAGLVQASQVDQLRADLERVTVHANEIRRRIETRRAYLAGEITAAQASLREELQQVRTRLGVAEAVSRQAADHLDGLATRHADGLVPDSELRQAELWLSSARAEERLARLELEMLLEALAE